MKADRIASLILAAGRGSRMKGFEGNKTLLPLVPAKSPFEGTHPILIHILKRLPPGPKALVVHHRKEEVIAATRSLGLRYCEQPALNGTGGALLAARIFIEEVDCNHVIVTMGDVPLVLESTYARLVKALDTSHLVVLGFRPADRRQYGVLDTEGNRVRRIVEWKYWKDFPEEAREKLRLCNSGIYAMRKDSLLHGLDLLGNRPHTVVKERDNRMVEIQEFFITDLVELMGNEGFKAGYVLSQGEDEVMGIDDLASLIKAQELFRAWASAVTIQS